MSPIGAAAADFRQTTVQDASTAPDGQLSVTSHRVCSWTRSIPNALKDESQNGSMGPKRWYCRGAWSTRGLGPGQWHITFGEGKWRRIQALRPSD